MNRTGRATRRSRLLTVLGIVLAALIAGGCLLFTDHLLGLQQEKLLSQVHFFPQEETDTVEETALEPEQIATILRYQDTNNSYDHLHDPKSGQINMEQAITAAKDGLEYF